MSKKKNDDFDLSNPGLEDDIDEGDASDLGEEEEDDGSLE